MLGTGDIALSLFSPISSLILRLAPLKFQYLGGKIFVRKWGERPTNTDEARCQEFYNGDLEGIYQKLDYLQSLGVTAIYLNPIFVSRSVVAMGEVACTCVAAYSFAIFPPSCCSSNHKYDTIDYFNVSRLACRSWFSPCDHLNILFSECPFLTILCLPLHPQVDPHLGGNEALAKLSTELHRRGMKLILDAVLNHISVHHKWFDKYNGG